MMQISRDLYLNRLISRQHNGMIKIITGIRRCGKSYLLFEIFYNYLKNSGVDDKHIIKIDLEDRRNKALRDPDALMAYIDGRLIDDGWYYILLDEVQKVKEFEDVLNSYLKIANVDVYVTGSNSKFLSRDVITEFRGRGDEIKIAPLNFGEYMSVYSGSREEGLTEYLTYGGLPKLFDLKGDDAKVEYLKGLFQKTYLTDIAERYKIKNPLEFEELLNVVASSIGSLINPSKIANSFNSLKNISISAPTVKNYLDILQDVFLIRKTMRFDIKGRHYIDTPAKYYFEDLGLRNARLNFRQQEITHLLENLVYNELITRGYSVDVGTVPINTVENGANVRKQLEVDFVCNQGSRRLYIQVAYRLPSEEKWVQELRSFRAINDSFQKFVITSDPVKKHQDENGYIILNIYDFLLNEDSLQI